MDENAPEGFQDVITVPAVFGLISISVHPLHLPRRQREQLSMSLMTLHPPGSHNGGMNHVLLFPSHFIRSAFTCSEKYLVIF